MAKVHHHNHFLAFSFGKQVIYDKICIRDSINIDDLLFSKMSTIMFRLVGNCLLYTSRCV